MTTQNDSPTYQRRPGCSLVGGVTLGLLIASLGLLFSVLLVKGYGRATETRRWVELPMTIVTSEVEEEQVGQRPKEYKAVIEYEFELDGLPYIGSGVNRVEGMTRHRNKAERKIERWPVGTVGTCFVNPDDPTKTLLKHNTKAVLYTIGFPGMFVVMGIGIALGTIRSHVKRRKD